jgi:hypothetical protein
MTTGASVAITISAHPLNRWFLATFARPFVTVDGVEHACRWSERYVLSVPPGDVRLSTFVRYRGLATPRGEGALRLRLEPGETVEVVATNGIMNGTPFTPRVA